MCIYVHMPKFELYLERKLWNCACNKNRFSQQVYTVYWDIGTKTMHAEGTILKFN